MPFAALAAAVFAATPADTVLRGGIVHTLDPGNPEATAIAIAGARLVYVGDDAGVAAFVGPRTTVEDLGGKTVLPGMIDAHMHLCSSGTELRDVQLEDAHSVADVQAALSAAAKGTRGWVRGGGWDLPTFEGHMDRAELDAAVPDRPVYLDSADGHSAWVNTKALAIAGITRSTADPPGGVIVRDANGDATGVLRESAANLVSDVMPDYPRAQVDQGLDDALREANANGLTTIIDANVGPGDLAAYARRERAGTLTVRVRGAIEEDAPPDPAEVRRVVALRQKYHDDRLSIDAIKLYIDGVIETHTALMLQPYADGTNGPALFTEADLETTTETFDKLGFQLHFHAIGDGAVHEALDALAAVEAADGDRDRRPLLAHLEVIEPADIPRFAALGAYADFQPLWAFPDTYIQQLTWPDLGPERSQWLYPIGAVEAAGGTVVAGSDWDVSSLDPFEGMEVAVTRQDPDDPGLVLTPQHAVTPLQILRAYTADAAKAAFLEDEVGTLTVGKRADLVVVDRDPLTVDPHTLSETVVLETRLDGAVVYRKAPVLP